jgi:SAM-dependent methyltransferase
MKLVALLSFFVILLVGATLSQAQGFRGSGGGGAMSMRSGAAVGRTSPTPPGIIGGQTVQRSQSVRGSFAQPTLQPSQTFQSRGFSSHSTLQPHHRGTVFVPPRHFFGRRPPFVLGLVPHHRHRHWFFHRHPGVLILDVPYGFSSSVITQVAPGVVRNERRYLDSPPHDARVRGPGPLAPFDPTPHEVVERMLALGGITKDDVVYDLGSGDGRILIAAAKKYGVRGVGFETDPGLVKLARENARRERVETLIEFRQQDFLSADLSPASVVTLYLSQDGNLAVRQQLMQQLKPGARVISYTFDMGEWQPKISESYRDAAGDTHLLYLWQIGEPMVFSDNSAQMLQPQPTRNGPLMIEVK